MRYTVVFSAAFYVSVEADDEYDAEEKAQEVAKKAAIEFDRVSSIADDFIVIHAGEDPLRIINDDTGESVDDMGVRT
jgi:Cu/Zn superoxide dismutase